MKSTGKSASRSGANDALALNRRQWLKTTSAAGGGLVMASSLGVGPSEVHAAPAALQVPRRTLGKTGEKIPILLMGGSLPLDPRFDPKLAECVKYGVNYIDAASGYSGGMCEPAVGAFMARLKNRDKVWITSKSEDKSPKGFEETFHKSLEKLQTSYIDMYYMHMLQKPEDLSDDMKAVVARLKKEKKLKHFGFSCHHGNVVELLNLAAKTPWVDSVMFRFNFRQYGNDDLNRAIDAAHKAKVGLIAMKTQGSAVSFEDKWQKFNQPGKWNKFQSVMKAVWSDDRISAAVSSMDSLDKVHDNVAAALDKTKLTQGEWRELWRYASATRGIACDGCDHLCGEGLEAEHTGMQIGATMRYVMYHDVYGQTDLARELFRKLPEEARRIANVNFAGASRACPHGVDVGRFMGRAAEILA